MMTPLKFLVAVALVLFLAIGIAAVVKKTKHPSASNETAKVKGPIEIKIDKEQRIVKHAPKATVKPVAAKASPAPAVVDSEKKTNDTPVVHVDRIAELFNKGEPKLPIVETITYKSRVSWQKGRPAWLSDYASYYMTSRHFISRSLTGKPDYFKKDIAEGDRFNVLRKDKNINFHLLIDTARCKMWFYYIDLDTNQRVLLKDYVVGLGRKDNDQTSGLLTPLGKYLLGSRIAIYKPKMTGYHKGQKIEMMQVFGTRWIPFEKEVSQTTAPAKGFGIHGVPWQPNEKGELVEDTSCLEKYLSDGCVRLSTKDMEEIFAIVITKPTFIELVRNFHEAKLPGIEK